MDLCNACSSTKWTSSYICASVYKKSCVNPKGMNGIEKSAICHKTRWISQINCKVRWPALSAIGKASISQKSILVGLLLIKKNIFIDLFFCITYNPLSRAVFFLNVRDYSRRGSTLCHSPPYEFYQIICKMNLKMNQSTECTAFLQHWAELNGKRKIR